MGVCGCQGRLKPIQRGIIEGRWGRLNWLRRMVRRCRRREARPGVAHPESEGRRRPDLNDAEARALNEDVKDRWNRVADFWSERMGEGNDFHRVLVSPSQERLLALEQDDLVLEIACGNGQFTRRMAQLGARVVASDGAERMIANARASTTENADRIEFSGAGRHRRRGAHGPGRAEVRRRSVYHGAV